MLKDYKRPKEEDRDSLKEEIRSLREKLLAQQQQVREAKVPILVLVEGWAAASSMS